MLSYHHQASLTSHAEACHLLWPLSVLQYTYILAPQACIQVAFKHEQGTGSPRAWEIFMAEGLDEGPAQLVQAVLRPSTYSYKLPLLHVYYLFVGCAKSTGQSFARSLAFSWILLSVSSRVQMRPSPRACIYPARLTTILPCALCPWYQVLK